MKPVITFDMSEVEGLVSAIDDASGPAMQETFNQLAELTRGEAVKAIQSGPATGIVYEKSNPRRTHQASAPGEAPMTDEGRLASSIAVDVKSPASVKRVRDAKAETGSNLEYADWLENGTSRMEARPFMFPAFIKTEKYAIPLLRQALARRLRAE